MAKDKSNKLKARLPRGLADRTPGELAATRAMIEKIRAVYELYGFEPVETPAIEYTDALGKFLPDQDRPNEGVFSFQDDDEQWLSLRYDLTAPLARYVAENFDALPKPYRSYRYGYVYRNEIPFRPLPDGWAVSMINHATGRRVYYDDCRELDGTMIEAKGPGFGNLLRSESMQEKIGKRFTGQAERQIAASGGRDIDWYFADEKAADFARELFMESKKLERINVRFVPAVTR